MKSSAVYMGIIAVFGCITSVHMRTQRENLQCTKLNEEYRIDGACPETCEHGKAEWCTKNHVEGCFCKEGFIRKYNGDCVKPENCLRRDIRCTKDHEEYTVGSPCPMTCEMNTGMDNPDFCLPTKVEGCFCKKGLIRNGNNDCVKPEDCPRDKEPNLLCDTERVYKRCGSACPWSCMEIYSLKVYGKTHTCPSMKCVEGCFCKPGYVEYHGKCKYYDKCYY